jgi:small-conductance mechanosensitive channel
MSLMDIRTDRRPITSCNVMVVSIPAPVCHRLQWLARAVLLLAACLALAERGRPSDSPPDEKNRTIEKDKTVAIKKFDLPPLTNEELLKQADTIYEKASRDYLARLRGLATAEALLEEVRKQIDGLKPPAPADDRPAGEDAAKKAVDAARAKQDLVRRKLKLVQTRKERLDRVTVNLEACVSATVAFQNAIDDLKAYALECDLRVKDGSLAGDKVPAALKPGGLEKKQEQLIDELAGLKSKSAEVEKAQSAIGKLLEDANKAALAADADVVEASKNLVREQQRREQEKTYAGKKPDEMIAELMRMVDEGIGLKGTYELSLRKFNARAREADRLRKELAGLKQPDTKVPQFTRAEDVETAAKSIQELIGYYKARTKKIEDLRAALTAQVSEGGEFEADAAVSEEHLFKMQVLADLLKKKGVAEDQLPERARSAALEPATKRQKESASVVRAATEKAKAELVVLEQQRNEANSAGEAATKQLANLKESRDVTLAALKWENQLQTMTSPKVVETFATTRRELDNFLAKLQTEEKSYTKAVTAVAEAKARLEGLKDPFLRTAEEEGQAEKQKLLGELRKEAGLERPTKEPGTSPPPGDTKKIEPEKKQEPDTRPELEKASDRLSGFQQLLAGRVRVLGERETKTKEMLAALDELEKQATAYAKTLAEARLLALQLNATAVDLKKRLGKGDLPDDAIPDGVTDALRLELRTRLDATATTVLNTVNQLQQDRDQLRRPDPEGEALTTSTKELLTLVGKRLDLLADLKRLAADYKRDKSARPTSEIKRLDQIAADRLAAESSGWDTLLGLDSSKTAKSQAELLESYYRELVEIEEKEDNVHKQHEKVEQLIDLTQQETTALTRVLPMLKEQSTRLEAAREEEAVLAHARLRPDRAEELLRAYQTKTGRLLVKPLPIADKDKEKTVEEIGNRLFDRYVRLEAAKKWNEALAARLTPTGVKAEAGTYQDELAGLNAASAADTRRIQTLTGSETAGPTTGGEIGKSRAELARIRTHGVLRIGLEIAAILLAAFLLPRLVMWILRRLIGGDGNNDFGLALSAVRAIVKVTVWVVAIALVLSILGFNVTAILAGLGIGGLAIGLAAQPMIADVIGAIVIFIERRFKIGDVIRFGSDDPARVVGLTWRSTQVKSIDGVIVSIPNRKVTEATIHNLTRTGGTYDSLNVSVTTQQDVSKVLAVIKRTMEENDPQLAEHGVAVKEFNQKGETKTIKYRFWWLLPDYESRNRTRDVVFARISASLGHEDMAGTEISLA